MDAHRLARMQQVFDAALERPVDERDRFVDEACAGDTDLGERVKRLLRAGEASPAGEFVSAAVRAAALSFGTAGDYAGRMLGPYRLVRELGHGGMGTVWLAERVDDAYRAQVAIKLVRGGFASEELARRFRAERQILADLHHPHVAALLDGGEAPDGTPYLVMEYIDGWPITEWAAQRHLPLDDRLRLFRQVCEAVQHAHGSLVVHRDIKPSNVLVGADGVPKLLDFGIAKLLTTDEHAETTVMERRLTPSYASPEQLRGGRITVATDVYSLGVLLYELVVGAHPFADADASTDEVRRRVLELEAPRPSDVLRKRPTVGVSARAVAGDLDNIVAKAMRKEAEMRYASVAQLADDVDRMLAGQPVLARSTSVAYRARKFVARHKTAMGAVLLLFLSLTGGLGATFWQARRANAARATAESALTESNAVKDFLTNLFQASDPNENRGATVTARDLLDRGVKRVDSLSAQPRLQADFLHVLAGVERSVGEYRTALKMYAREIAIVRSLPGTPDSTMVDALTGLGNAYDVLGVPDSSAAAYEQAIAYGRTHGGVAQPSVIAAISAVADEYSRLGQDAKAEAAFRQAIDLQTKVLGPTSTDRAYTMNDLGLMLTTQGRYTEAEPLLRESLRMFRQADSGSVSTADATDNLGMMLREAGHYDRAEPYLRHAYQIRRKVLGTDARFMGESYFSLGYLLALRGRPDDFAESDSLLQAALDVFRTTLGPTHRAVGYAEHALGVLAFHRGDLPQAESWLQRAKTLRESTKGDSPRETARTLVRLGQVQMARHERGALATYREADSLARATLDSLDPVRSRAAVGLAIALAGRGERPIADTMYSRAVAALAGRIGAEHPIVREDCAAGRAVGLRDDACASGS